MLKDKIVVVTSAAGRIGSAFARTIVEFGTLEWSVNDNHVYKYDINNRQPEVIFTLPKKYYLNETYISELNNFIGIINQKTKTNVTIDDSIQTMVVLDSIDDSSKKEKVVHINNYRN